MVHAATLTYVSDMGLIATRASRTASAAANPPPPTSTTRSGSTSPPRFDGWLLYTSESPIAHAARALILGQMYRQDGTRIAS